MWKFLKDHPIAVFGMVIAGIIDVGSRVNDAWTLFNAGLPGPAWEAIAALIFVTSVIGLLYRWHCRQEARPSTSPDWDKPLEKRFRITFANETVLLDGHEFIECSFDNVTFKYNGTRPFRFTGKTTGNSRKVTSDNVVVGQTLTLIHLLAPQIVVDYDIHKTGSR